MAALPYCLGVLAIRSRDGYGWRPAKLRTGKAAALVRLTGSGAFRTFALEREGLLEGAISPKTPLVYFELVL